MTAEISDDERTSFLERLVQFSQLLRDEGFGVTPSETLDVTEAITITGVLKLEEFRNALRTTLVKRSEDYERFEALFRKFWLRPKNAGQLNPLGRVSTPRDKIARTLEAPNSNQVGRGRVTAGSMFQSSAPVADSIDKLLAVYSPLETQSRKSFAELDAAKDRLILKRGLKSFARATATLPGRRYSISEGRELDFRRTLRTNLKTGGQGVEIEQRSKKISKSRIVVLADISGSMDIYSKRILKLIYHMSNTIHGSVIFGFSTKVVPLNRFLQGKSLRESSDLISRNVDSWSSGTRIGSALKEVLSKYPGVLRSSAVFVIISDGWELGDLDTFRMGLREIRRQVRKIIWLNPQADSPDYQPLAEGMKIALPLVDVFAGLDVFSNRIKFRSVFGATAKRFQSR
jgi:uncharacterized protein with von Willebrand factor type A (vWA) domain